MTRFAGNCYLTLTLTLFYLEIHAHRIILCESEQSLLYSNVSNKNLLINHDYYLFFEKMDYLGSKCIPICPPMQLYDNALLGMNFQRENFEFQEDITMLVFVKIKNTNSSCVFNITFIDKFDDIIYTCPKESYFTIEDRGYIPLCNFSWCLVPDCQDIRENKYFRKVTLWDIDMNETINTLNPVSGRSHYHIKLILNIHRFDSNRLIGRLDRIVTFYLINGSKFICRNQSGRAILVNVLETFNLQCNYTSNIPFLKDKIKLQWGFNTFSNWFLNFTYKFYPGYTVEPTPRIINPIIIFLSGRSSYILKEIVFVFYVKFGSSLCNQGQIYEVSTLESFSCFGRNPHFQGFYIKIQNLSNQIPESIQIHDLDFKVLNTWIPDIIVNLMGKLFIKELKINLTESEREIMDFRMFIKKTVIHNLKILPESLSINLPDKIIVSCQTRNVPVISHFWMTNGYSRSVTGCSYIIDLPQLNYTSITIFVAIHYEYYWYNVSKIYLIGRIPSIVIITSKFPKLSQNVMCYTDGENSLYTFQWICNDSNEPKDLIAVEYITSFSNDLIFHETAPLVTYYCMCMSKYNDVFNRQIFEISADVELNLKDNDLIDCELAKNTMDETTWTIFVIYILIFFMIPSVFFLIAYFVTDGRIKSVIQSKIFNKLGFIKKRNEKAETIPFFIIAKSDVGEMAFNRFLKKITDFDRTIESLKVFKQMSFQFEVSKSHSSDNFLNINKKSNVEVTPLTFSTSAEKRRILKLVSPFSKYNYMSSFGKLQFADDSSMGLKHHKKTLGLQLNNSPFLSHESLINPQKNRKGISEFPNNTTVKHLMNILDGVSEKEDTSSFKTISSNPKNRKHSSTSPKPKKPRLENKTLITIDNLDTIPIRKADSVSSTKTRRQIRKFRSASTNQFKIY